MEHQAKKKASISVPSDTLTYMMKVNVDISPQYKSWLLISNGQGQRNSSSVYTKMKKFRAKVLENKIRQLFKRELMQYSQKEQTEDCVSIASLSN